MAKKKVSVEGAKATIRAELSRALAEALIGGLDNAKEEGRPLTQLQKMDVATMHIMAYDHAVSACEAIDVQVQLESGRLP